MLRLDIYNAATRPGQSNEEWLASARENFITIEDKMHIVPHQAIFESWERLPVRSITDASGPGEDYLVKEYVAKGH
jgi:hypothetical protein